MADHRPDQDQEDHDNRLLLHPKGGEAVLDGTLFHARIAT